MNKMSTTPYRRARPKQIHSPAEPMWQQQQPKRGGVEFGNQFNNPDPQTQAFMAARSTGRQRLRLPHTTASYAMWYGEMRPNGQSMHVMPDATLTSQTATYIWPEQLRGLSEDHRLGNGLVGLWGGN